MVNLVIVSHSAQLGQGVGELARQMLMGGRCQIAIAAGIDDPENPIGTDPIKVMEAIESVADTDHVLVMMDIGSALLSAETAMDLLDPAIAAKVRLCAAPLVEGTLAATVSAATGSDIEKVIADAENALLAKRAQLGIEAPAPSSSAPATDQDAQSVTVVVKNPNGLHLRPASRLISALGGFNARLVLEKDGKCVTPDSINQIALLQVRCNDTLRLIASGPEAPAALAAFQALAAKNFGDSLTAPEDSNRSPGDTVLGQSQGQALWYRPGQEVIEQAAEHGVDEEARRLKLAISRTLDDLNTLTALAATRYSEDIAAIFSGHHTLLDDAELYDTACELIRNGQYSAEWAWHQVLSELSQQYRQLDDAYLQARYIDVDDLCHRTLGHLAGAVEGAPLVQKPTIILAENIFPSTVLQLDPQQVKGICLTDGSPQSHGGIIAAVMGIPFLCQQGDAIKRVQNGDALTLDHRQVLLSR